MKLGKRVRHLFAVAILVASMVLGITQPVLAAEPVELSVDTLTMTEGETQEISVNLSEPIISEYPEPYFTLDINASNPNRLSPDTAAIYYEPAEWAQEKTFKVTAVDDAKINGNTQATIDFVVYSDSEYYNEYTGSISINVIDNDVAPVVTNPKAGQNIPAGSLTVTGTASPNQELNIKIDGTKVGTTTADGSGNWDLLVQQVTAGNHSITAEAIGNFHFAFMANPHTSSIDVVNVDTHSYEHEIENAFSAGASYNPQKNIVYSASSTGDICSIRGYDPTTYEEVAVISRESPSFCRGLAFSPDGNTAWVLMEDGVSFGDHYLMKVDLNTQTMIGQTLITEVTNRYPSGMEVTPDGSEIWIQAVDSIEVYSTAAHDHLDSLLFADPDAAYRQNIIFNKAGTRAYTSNADNGKVFVFDTTTKSIIDEVVVAEGATFIALTPDESQLFVAATYPAMNISVIDVDSFTVVNSFAVPDGMPPESIAFAPNGNWVVGDDHGTGAIFFGNAVSGPEVTHTIIAPKGGSYYSSTSNFVTTSIPSVLGASTVNAFTATAYGAPNTGLGR